MRKKRFLLVLLFVSYIFFSYFFIKYDTLVLVRQIFWSIFITVFPGWLLLRTLKIKTLGNIENLCFSVALSLLSLMLIGLTINEILPFFGVSEPLQFIYIYVALSIYLFILWLIVFLRSDNFLNNIPSIHLNYLDNILLVLSVITTVLSILGAFRMNNGASNSLTVIALGLIGFIFLLAFLLRNRVNSITFPIIIFFVASSILLMTSLRGWHITGHDIKREYNVFQLTSTNSHWSMTYLQSAYNACLSITILPTIYARITRIPDPYIYKFLFQILFSFSPVIVYLISRQFLKNIEAFLCAFVFMSFPTFINDMPMLNRQEISLLFFGLLIYILTRRKSHNDWTNKILKVLFSIGLIVSHYSTSYVTAGILILGFLFFNLSKKITFVRNYLLKQYCILEDLHSELSYSFLFIFLMIVFSWSSQITSTFSSVTSLTQKIIQNIQFGFQEERRSTDVNYGIFSKSGVTQKELLDSYSKTSYRMQPVIREKIENNELNYALTYIPERLTPLTPLGNSIFKTIDPYYLNKYFRTLSSLVFQILVIIGMALILFFKSLRKKMRLELLSFSFAMITLVAIFTIAPYLSVEYGLLRFYQQCLFVLAPFFILGIAYIPLRYNFLKLFTPILILLIFWSMSGFIPSLTGRFLPQLHLNQFGLYYDAYYYSGKEGYMFNWMQRNLPPKAWIQADQSATSQLINLHGLGASGLLLPEIISKKSYIPETQNNVNNKAVIANYLGTNFRYSFPFLTIEKEKNTIYDNGDKLLK